MPPLRSCPVKRCCWSARALPTASGSYYLTKDIEISSSWTIGNGTVIDLCLNDHSITMTADEKAVISISGGTLNLYDCGTTVRGYTTDTWPAKIGSGSGSFTGGYITHTGGTGVRSDGLRNHRMFYRVECGDFILSVDQDKGQKTEVGGH